ncbi:hypothetical protein HY642_02755 [Candidatus Woesearchaeota archaeon]|nr:hypothetical protein [Candidatus Woesearchaeota archaeon]
MTNSKLDLVSKVNQNEVHEAVLKEDPYGGCKKWLKRWLGTTLLVGALTNQAVLSNALNDHRLYQVSQFAPVWYASLNGAGFSFSLAYGKDQHHNNWPFEGKPAFHWSGGNYDTSQPMPW